MKKYIISLLFFGLARFALSQCNPPAITAADTIFCPGDSMQICAPSGYTAYHWNSGQTTQCIFVTQAGDYRLTVTDNTSCTAVSSPLVINTYPVVSVSLLVENDTLFSFGMSSYQWLLNGNPIPGATAIPYIASTPGIYAVRVVDSFGCTETSTPVVIPGSPLSISFISDSIQSSSCSGGDIILNPLVLGGIPPYTYSWSSPTQTLSCYNCQNPETVITQTFIATVTVTDNWGSSVAATDTVFARPTPNLTVTTTHDTADYFRSDTITATGSGGSLPYNFEWIVNGVEVGGGTGNGAESQLFYNYPGIFECVITNNYGCTDTSVTYIHGELTVSLVSITDNKCSYDSSGAINISVTGGSGTYTYKWSNGATTQNLSHLYGGVYNLTVYDNLGNVGILTELATSPPPIQITQEETLIPGIVYFGYLLVNDFVNMIPTGGTPPYTYAWNVNINDNGSIEVTSPDRVYTVTITDASGCSATAQTICGVVTKDVHFEVPENHSSNLNILQYDAYQDNDPWQPVIEFPPFASWTGPNHGNVAVNTDQTVSYTPTNGFTGLDTFMYIACLADSNYSDTGTHYYVGLCDTSFAFITVIDSFVFSAQVQPATCSSSCNGSITEQVSGGVAPYKFNWNNGDTTQTISGLCSGTGYKVTVTDANHVSVTDSVGVGGAILSLNLYYYPDSLSAIATFENDSIPTWIFTWSTGYVDTEYYLSQIPISQSGFYCVTATSRLGDCVLSSCDSIGCIGCVWPGDANDDGLVDNNDLLAVGLGYGATGPVRPNATIDWVGQTSTDWPGADTLPSGTNYKFVDCNGDGSINADDTLAILRNFDLTHLRGSGIVTPRAGLPDLDIILSVDSAKQGDTIVATIVLGSASLPANNIYGLAFTFNYDPTIVDSTKTSIAIGSSWLGSDTDRIYIAPDFSAVGQIKFGITRIDHVTRSGNGNIATVTFVITTDNINGRRGAGYSYFSTEYYISDLTVIDNHGNVMQINEGSDSAIIAYVATGINEIPDSKAIQLFPNPANEQLTIATDPSLTVSEIRITDLLGNLIIRQLPGNRNHTVMDVSLLSTGAYFAEVVTGSGNVVKRFVITR